jgi:hypothetical protein
MDNSQQLRGCRTVTIGLEDFRKIEYMVHGLQQSNALLQMQLILDRIERTLDRMPDVGR